MCSTGNSDKTSLKLFARSFSKVCKQASQSFVNLDAYVAKHFNMKNDFTPEEEEQVRKENEWCEQ